MTTVTEYFEQAQLSMAAYALNLTPGISGTAYTDKLEAAGMSQTQAEAFANTYTVVDQYTDPVSGFSGTVFADSAGNNYFALRGSELDIADWIGTNFGDIGADGIAIAQGVALFNWLQRLVTPEGQMAQQVEYVPIFVDPFTGAVTPASIIAIDPVASLGYLSGASGFTVAGHSLGGHLAMMMSRLAPDLVSEVYTYNAPGFDEFGTDWDGDIMSHLNVPGDIINGVGKTPGTTQTFFSESANQGPLDTHDKVPLTDALAVAALLADLDPTLTLNQLRPLFEAASNEPAASLEAVVNALGDLLGAGAEVEVDNRDQLYGRINTIRTAIYVDASLAEPELKPAYQGLQISVLGTSSAALASAAQADTATGQAHRYALTQLDPFVITGADDATTAALYADHNAAEEIDLYDPDTGLGSLTDQYLADRARMLALSIRLNTVDAAQEYLSVEGETTFDDLGSGKSLLANQGLDPASNGLGPSFERSWVRFGAEASEATGELDGGAGADHLFGGDGFDVIHGNGGDDYLEGGLGNDQLFGDEGSDSLLGNAGNDILVGNKSGAYRYPRQRKLDKRDNREAA